jgi:hypothetical protein
MNVQEYVEGFIEDDSVFNFAEWVKTYVDEVLDGKTLRWESKEETRTIDYNTGSERFACDFVALNELLRTRKHEAAGKMLAEANEGSLNFLVLTALQDYDGLLPEVY